MKKNEKIFVTRPSMPDISEYINEIQDIWNEQWLTNMGPKHELLEQQLTEYLQVKHCILTNNGHAALELALTGLELDGEVITTPYTFVSTTNAIVRCGLKPVFCDIKPDDYTIDCDKVEELITEKTVAILAVHVYGNPCKVEKLQEIADRYNIKLIFDAAHAFGVAYKGKGIATYGDASIFSFHATKVFNTIEGGAVCTDDDQLYERLKAIRDFGIVDEENVDYVGFNAKMNEFQAAMGICNLRGFKNAIARRRKIFEIYRTQLSDVQGIKLMSIRQDTDWNYAYMPIFVDESVIAQGRDAVKKALESNNIFCRKYFYPITSDMKMYKSYAANVDTARKCAMNVLTIPIYEELSEEQVYKICDVIKNFKRI